ncbi:N-acetyltransferase [Herbaspirillum seropedicae]|nr:N-acetyltransferase [Herbaspirillum seropedicae]
MGYDSTAEEVGERIASVQRSSTDMVLVATSAEHVIGCISLHVMPLFHAAGFLGRVTSLVVDAGCRGQGIGKALMESANEWFVTNGCVKVEVTSGDQRESAHQFYESLGFSRDGQRFSKKISLVVATASLDV